MASGRIPATGQLIQVAGPLGLNPRTPQPKTLYVNDVALDGWLLVLDEEAHVLLPLCKYTKLSRLHETDGRVYFRVMDGSQMGKTVSLKDDNVRKYLGIIPPKRANVKVAVVYVRLDKHWVSVAREGQVLTQQLATLSVAGITIQVTMDSAVDTKYTPLPAGDYTLLLPDAPHGENMTRFYRKTEPNLRYDQVWFPIAYGDNSRYVHVGNVSEGCITVLELAQWATLHEVLISHRRADGRSVAELVVTGKREEK